jgi:hypothetical protein
MFFNAAFTSGTTFSWLDPAGFFCGLAKAKGAFQKTSNAATSEGVLAGIIFFTQWTIRLMGLFLSRDLKLAAVLVDLGVCMNLDEIIARLVINIRSQ